jgi:hypothetical protein
MTGDEGQPNERCSEARQHASIKSTKKAETTDEPQDPDGVKFKCHLRCPHESGVVYVDANRDDNAACKGQSTEASRGQGIIRDVAPQTRDGCSEDAGPEPEVAAFGYIFHPVADD